MEDKLTMLVCCVLLIVGVLFIIVFMLMIDRTDKEHGITSYLIMLSVGVLMASTGMAGILLQFK